jgi:hypothetical protein
MNRGPGQCNGSLKYFKSTEDVVVHWYFVCGNSCFIQCGSFTNCNKTESLWIVFVIRENQNAVGKMCITHKINQVRVAWQIDSLFWDAEWLFSSSCINIKVTVIVELNVSMVHWRSKVLGEKPPPSASCSPRIP